MQDQPPLITDLPATTTVPNGIARKQREQLLDLNNHVTLPNNFVYVQTVENLNLAAEAASECEVISVDVETRTKQWTTGCTVALNLYTPSNDTAYFIPNRMSCATRNFSDAEIADAFKGILENPKIKKIGQEFKYDVHFIRQSWGTELKGYFFDTLLAARMLNENEPHDLETLCAKYLNIPAWKISMRGQAFELWPIRLATKYGCMDAINTYKLYLFQNKHLDTDKFAKIKSLLYTVEMPNVVIATQMEKRGIAFDMEYFTDIVMPTVAENIKNAQALAFEHMGDTCNLDSPEQVAHVLFDIMKLPRVDENHVNFAALTELKNQGHVVAAAVLEHRKWSTLKKMFVNQLPRWAYNGRIHTRFNTLGTETGRWSSSKPDLQNIPKRIGPIIRRAFIPSPGYALVSMDYSQMELRMLAHLGKVKGLIDAFKSGMDVHAAILCKVFSVDPADYLAHQDTDRMVELRVYTKNINFGIPYGMGAVALAGRMNKTPEVAQEFINYWFGQFPEAKRYQNVTKRLAYDQGYVETILGRRRRLPDSRSSDKFKSSHSDREAVNAPIQGSVADLVKLTMNAHDVMIEKRKWPYEALLNEHDEIMYEVPIPWLERHHDSLDELKATMENIYPLDVPVVVNQEILSRWGDKQNIDFEVEEDDALI